MRLPSEGGLTIGGPCGIAVTGGRSHRPSPAELSSFEALWGLHQGAVLLHGDCTGVDAALKRWAIAHGIPHQPFPADWATHGKAAGPLRNREMIEVADLLVAFHGGRGTANCIACAERRGVPVFRVETDGTVVSPKRG